MSSPQQARLLRIHIAESDRAGDRPLYETIVQHCRQLQIAGATVLRGLEGYGGTAEMHRHRLAHRDQPVVVLVVDSPANIARLLAVIEPLLDGGLMAISEVQAVRITGADPAAPPESACNSGRSPSA